MEVCINVYEKVDEECEWVRSRTFMTEDCDVGGEDVEAVFRADWNDIRVIVNKKECYLFCYVVVVFEIGG